MPVRKKTTTPAELAAKASEIFDVFLRPLERLRKNPRRAMATPRTTLDRLKRDVEASFDEQLSREPADALLSRMFDFLPSEADQEMLRVAQERIDDDRATLCNEAIGAQFLALYDVADEKGPVSPMLYLFGDFEEEAVDSWTVAAKFEKAERSKGEKRAVVLLEAMPDLLEKVYLRYLHAVWAMSFLAEGEWPSAPPGSFGSLVKQVASRALAYPGLVDADAGHLRNAVAHRHLAYLPSTDSIEFRDRSASWAVTLTVDMLQARLESMFRLAAILSQKLRSIIVPELFLRGGFFALLPLIRDALQGDAVAAKALAEKNPSAAFTSQFFRQSPPPGKNLWLPLRK